MNLLMAHGGTSGWWRCCRWTSTPGTGWTTEDAVQTSKAGAWTVYGRLYKMMSIVHINVVCMKQNSTAGIMGFCTYYKNRYSFLVIVKWSILVPHLSRESCFLVMSRLYGLFTVNFYKLVCWHFLLLLFFCVCIWVYLFHFPKRTNFPPQRHAFTWLVSVWNLQSNMKVH